MSFLRILAPVDFSDDSRTSAALALALTDPRGELAVLHVDLLPDLGHTEHGAELLHAYGEHQRARFTGQLDALLGELQDRAGRRPMPQVRAESRTGDPVDGICALAASWPAELLVMGSHGESGSVRFLFGSVTGKVTRQAPCPVLVTRPGHAERIAATGALHRALVAVDYSPFSAPAARLAARLLAPGGTLVLMHAWHSPASLPLPFTGERRQVAADRLHRFAAGLDLGGVTPDVVLDVGSPAAQILTQIDRMDADLVVVGAHGRDSMVEKILGTVADRVLRHADIPVLVLPEGALDADNQRRARELRAPP